MNPNSVVNSLVVIATAATVAVAVPTLLLEAPSGLHRARSEPQAGKARRPG